METKTIMTKKGVTTLQKKGSEQHEHISLRGKSFVHYDYRHISGKLFSCVKVTLIQCLIAKDEWVQKTFGS